MEIVIWILVQVAVFAAAFWIVKRSRQKELGEVKRRPVTRSREDNYELVKLREMRAETLTVPLSELARPMKLEDIVGQREGIRALRSAISAANPQHVIIYGPPGVGKTCAARLILEEAKKNPASPFNEKSAFIELDATCVRFDERSIADPLIGSVHDPIYQGAGTLGAQGVPQPKPGAVTRAHCGVLFLDEIGELHPVQMNKLLKVLEDRRVSFESAYYSPDNNAIPPHIRDIFEHGLPADFRLIGATTRNPEDMPSALRSRCVELFFDALDPDMLKKIASDAAERLCIAMDEETASLCADYSSSGRDAVNIVQLAGSFAMNEGRSTILISDIEWVARACRHQKRERQRIADTLRAGTVMGLGVSQGGTGSVIEICCSAQRCAHGEGTLSIGGIVAEEELELRSRKLRRRSAAGSSCETACEAFTRSFGVDRRDYHIAFNVVGGIPMDGPSAGIALAVALMSAVTGKPSAPLTVYTGEITPSGEVRRVGGVYEKLASAAQAGARAAVIPKGNYEPILDTLGLDVITVENIVEVMRQAFLVPEGEEWIDGVIPLFSQGA